MAHFSVSVFWMITLTQIYSTESIFIFFNACISSHHHYPVPIPPVFIFRWKFNGKDLDIDMDFNYSLVEGNLLINNPLATKHSGVYQCITTNAFGTILSREAKVEFACKCSLNHFFYICEHLKIAFHSLRHSWLLILWLHCL